MTSNVSPGGVGGKSSQHQTPANAHLGEDKPKLFDEQGAIGKQFTGMLLLLLLSPPHERRNRVSADPCTCTVSEQGAVGGAAQAIGGPFDKEGAIGKQFTSEGAIGGAVQNSMGGTSKKSN